MIAGHGTLALEILEDVPDVQTVVVGVGGGGLISGIVTALQGRGVRIVAVEPEQAQAFRAASRPGTACAWRRTRSPTASRPRSRESSHCRSAAELSIAFL